MLTIRTDGISDEQKVSADFQFVYQGITAQLRQPGFITALCTHEAAHLFYFSLIGNTSYDILPARIWYAPRTKQFEGSLASVQPHNLKLPQDGNFAQWFDFVARGHVAGGVVARKLSPGSDGGDEDDKTRFLSMCARLNSKHGVSLNAEALWETAKKQVAEDITRPDVWQQIQQKATLLQLELGA